MKRNVWKMTTLALAFCGYASFAGCNGSGGTSPAAVSQDATGTVSFALQVGGAVIQTASYTITGDRKSVV